MGVVLGVFCKFFGMPQRGGLCVMYLGGGDSSKYGKLT